MKEITGKSQVNRFPKSINIHVKAKTNNSHMVEEFNKYFNNVGLTLVSKIQNTSKAFENFLFPVEKNMEYRDLTFEEFQKAFKLVKCNKAARHDDIDSNVIIKIYDEISYPLVRAFFKSS